MRGLPMARFADLIGSIDQNGPAPDLRETQAEVAAALAALAPPDPTEALTAAFGTRAPDADVLGDTRDSDDDAAAPAVFAAVLDEIDDDLLPTFPPKKGRR
jgi:hypothetical protein